MAWIKRNLFFVIGGGIALLLLGGAGFYIYKGWSRNSAAFDKLNEVVGQLKGFIDQKPSPGNQKVNNTAIAKDQEQELQAWIKQTKAYFKPVPAIPTGASVSSAAFSGALQKTVDQLRHEADASSVLLPPKFEFSFTAEKDRMTFAPGSLDALATQLGEVKALSEILFATRINAIDSIQRVRMAEEDLQGSQSDYTEQRPVTNDLAIITPYVVTFRCFSPELSRVISSLATSPNPFIIKSVNVERADAASALPVAGGYGEMPGAPPMRMPGEYATPPVAPAAQSANNRGGLPTVLKEQLLRVTVEVDLVKLLPKT
jgi:hypothetical protein